MTLGVLRERPTATLTARDMSEWSGRASAVAEGRGSWRLVAPSRCLDCRCFPCRCALDTTTRAEPCLCGGEIVVADRSDASLIAAAVLVHNASTGHAQAMVRAGWR